MPAEATQMPSGREHSTQLPFPPGALDSLDKVLQGGRVLDFGCVERKLGSLTPIGVIR